jgi:hypothetical protein
MHATTADIAAVLGIIEAYFRGLYTADVPALRELFAPDAYLKAPGLRRSLEQWLSAVATRPVPEQQGAAYGFSILSVEVIKDQAMVKAECPLFEFFYVDFLGLLKEDGRWRIVNKMYTAL